jgi:hypothetical protein
MSHSPRVLLTRLSCRTSSKGREYLSGFLGCARVVAFKAAEPNKFGNEQWELYVAEPQQRDDSRSAQGRPQTARHEPPGRAVLDAAPRSRDRSEWNVDPGQRDTGDLGRPFDDEIPF